MQHPTPEARITVAQAADRLGLTRRGVIHRIARGDIEAVKVGDGLTSAYLIPLSEVERHEAQIEEAS